MFRVVVCHLMKYGRVSVLANVRIPLIVVSNFNISQPRN